MIYPVSVLFRSMSGKRQEVGSNLIEIMKKTSPTLIYQAIQISDELIRAAVLLPERWNEAIEEASRIYFQ